MYGRYRFVTNFYGGHLLVLLCLLTVGPSPHAKSERSLESWLQDELLPYVSNRLGRHPRLKDVAFTVVVVEDNRVAGQINALEKFVKQRVVSHLETVEGANLLRNTPVLILPNRLTMMNLDCPARRRPNVWVTIEVTQPGLNDSLQISVRAFDLTTNRWVRGFKMVWRGQPSEQEQQLLSRQDIDIEQSGTRALPYTGEQIDVLATALARDAGCSLSSMGRRDFAVDVRLSTDSPPTFQRTALLLERYLDQYEEIETGSGSNPATVKIELKTFELDSGLYQVWIDLQGQKDSHLIEPIQPVYVSLNAGLEGRPDVSRPPTLEKYRPDNLIQSFDLIVPADLQRCQQQDPWQGREVRTLGPGSRLPSGACFAMRVQITTDETSLYLLSHTETGGLTRLLPNNCNALGLKLNQTKSDRGQTLHIPSFANGKPGIFRLDNRTGTEYVYAIAVTDEETEAKLLDQLRGTGDICTSASDRERTIPIANFREQLSQLAKGNTESLEWVFREFQHVNERTKPR